MTTPTKPRQLTYMERTARFPLDFSIVHDPAGKPIVNIPAAWQAENLVRLGPYANIHVTYAPRVHINAAPVFSAFFERLMLSKNDVITYDGGFYARLKRGVALPKAGESKDAYGKLLSNHSRGTAIDLNARWNQMGKPGAAPGETGSNNALAAVARNIRVEIETAGNRWPAGIVWGGDWHNASRDDMHFEVGTWEPA